MPEPDDDCREIARQAERDHPRWIVIFGAFSRQYVAFPRFPAERSWLQSRDPEELARKMDEAERPLAFPGSRSG
jgi:hypothetical protein